MNVSNADQAEVTESKSFCQLSTNVFQCDNQIPEESKNQSFDFDMLCNRELHDSPLSYKKRQSIRSKIRPHRRLFVSATSSNVTNQLNNSKIPSLDCNPIDCKRSSVKAVPSHKGLIDTSPIARLSLSTVNKENEGFHTHHASTSKQLMSHEALQTSPASLEISDEYDELVMEGLAHDQAFSESIHLS